jgi:uncharacterized delta-60 repeat protein
MFAHWFFSRNSRAPAVSRAKVPCRRRGLWCHTRGTGSAPGVEWLEDRTLLNGGGLDPTFGKAGQALTDVNGSLNDTAQSVVQQADGKLVVVGTSGGQLSLARYNPDGSLDVTFGRGGQAVTGLDTRYPRPAGVIIRPDGKMDVLLNTINYPIGLVADSQLARPINNNSFSVIQFNADGSLDAHYGHAGIAKITMGPGLQGVSALALEADGKLLVAGTFNSYSAGGSTGSDFLLMRISADGSLDTTFGTRGIVTTDFASSDDAAAGIVVQADGRIVVAGATNNYQAGTSGFAVARYKADGSLDSRFGTGGKVTTDFTGAHAAGVVLQPDGRIVVAGNVYQAIGPIGHQNVALARYNADGTLDNAFGSGGKQTADFGTGFTMGGIALQADGKLTVAGTAYEQINGPVVIGVTRVSHLAMARLNANGSLDTGFGTGGLVKTDIGKAFDSATSLIVQPNGKIVAAGSTDLHNGDYALVRYNGNGALDATFGTGGKVTTDFQGPVSVSASAAALQADGRLLIVGTAGSELIVVRYNADGTVDTGFGTRGEVQTDLGAYASAAGIVVQPNGKIIVAGSADQHFVLARYKADGSLDNAFGNGGKVSTDAGTNDTATSLALQADGKIIVVGQSYPPGGTTDGVTVTVARYNADGSPDSTFGTRGRVTTSVGTGAQRPSGVVVQPDGKLIVVANSSELTQGGGLPTPRSKISVLRYNPDGSLDIHFGTGGKVVTDDINANTVALQADGRIVVAGTTSSVGSPQAAVVLRYNADGSLDTGSVREAR